jgi:hypothetical protein
VTSEYKTKEVLTTMTMTAPRRVLSVLIAALMLSIAASCVDSRHPLSDEKTSTIDERFIGSWKYDNGDVWRVKKSADVKNAFDLKFPDPKAPATVLAFATTIKSKGYLSFRDPDADAGKRPDAGGYDIYQYVFVDKDTVQVRGMDPDVIVKAIAEKKLGGEIHVTKKTTRPIVGRFGKKQVVAEKTPVITDTPENLARYLRDHAAECYPEKTDYLLTFKRQK